MIYKIANPEEFDCLTLYIGIYSSGNTVISKTNLKKEWSYWCGHLGVDGILATYPGADLQYKNTNDEWKQIT